MRCHSARATLDLPAIPQNIILFAETRTWDWLVGSGMVDILRETAGQEVGKRASTFNNFGGDFMVHREASTEIRKPQLPDHSTKHFKIKIN
jgi:hypothetical protein